MGKRRRKRRHGAGAAALSPAVPPADPAQGRPRSLSLGGTAAGVRVTEHTALTLVPVWACVRVITEALSSLPLRVYRRLAGGKRSEAADHDVDWLLGVQANPETPAFHWRETTLAHALMWGNGYSEIERDAAGRPVWIWQLAPDRVLPDRTARGQLIYDVANPRQPNTVLDPADVLHLKGLSYDGLQGYGTIAMTARAVGLGLALEEYAGAFFANDATPGGALKHPTKLSETALQHLRETFEARHRGPAKGRRLAILEEGMDFVQFSVPNNDAQFLESRNFSVPEICRIFKVPPHKVAHLLQATFSNIEEQEIEFVVDCLHPWAARLEAEANIKLFGRTNRGTLYLQHDFNGRLRGNAQARGAYYHQMLGDGVFCINDVLQLEGRNPIGPEGDRRFVPLNMQPLDQAGQPQPAPGAPPAMPPTPPPALPDDDDSPDQPAPPELRPERVLLPVFADALGRVLRRETHRAQDLARRKADPEAWLAEHEGYVRDALAAPASALALLLGRETSALAGQLPALAAFHVADLRQRLRADTPATWEALAPALAARLLTRLGAWDGRAAQAAPPAPASAPEALAPVIHVHVEPAPVREGAAEPVSHSLYLTVPVTLHLGDSAAPNVTVQPAQVTVEAAAAQPAPVVNVHVEPAAVTVLPAQINVSTPAPLAAPPAPGPAPAPQVHVHVEPTPVQVTVAAAAAPNVTVQPAQVTVEAAAAPDVTVHVEAAPAPSVTVQVEPTPVRIENTVQAAAAPDVTVPVTVQAAPGPPAPEGTQRVEIVAMPRRKKTVNRDRRSEIDSTTEEDV